MANIKNRLNKLEKQVNKPKFYFEMQRIKRDIYINTNSKGLLNSKWLCNEQ